MTRNGKTFEALQEENDRLQQRIAELEQTQSVLQSVIDNAPMAIFAKDLDGRFLVANTLSALWMGMELQPILGQRDADLFPPEIVAVWHERNQQAITARAPIENEEAFPLEDGLHTFLSINFPIYNLHGDIYATGSVVTDITERKRAEEERLHLQQQVIEAQQIALREISTPLMPLADGVIAMSLIGAIDSERAQQVMETLLEGVARHQAESVILDITGVQIVDTQVANALVQVAQAVKLLGATIVLTGIQPHIAQTLIHLGVDLSGIITRNTLQSGIAYVLRRKPASYSQAQTREAS